MMVIVVVEKKEVKGETGIYLNNCVIEVGGCEVGGLFQWIDPDKKERKWDIL